MNTLRLISSMATKPLLADLVALYAQHQPGVQVQVESVGGVDAAKRVEAGEMLSYEDVQEILRIPLLGIIPESESVLHASNQGNPAIHIAGSEVSDAYKDVVARFLGEERPLRFADYEKPGILSRLFGGK